MTVPRYSLTHLAAGWSRLTRPWHQNYLAMYASHWGGIVTDPVLMCVPADDHLVHRGDGVFEAVKCLNGQIYSLEAHLERLESSARAIRLPLPPRHDHLREIIRETVLAGGHPDVLIRVVISRGPGGYSADPIECPESQLYVTVIRLKSPPEQAYHTGVRLVSTTIPTKPGLLAGIKSCDYLTNVLVKKAARDAGADYGATWDEAGFLAEGSTENIILVTAERELLSPYFERIVKGITLVRVLELARALVADGRLVDVRQARITREVAAGAREVMLCATTLDVLPVREWDGRTVGTGRPGPISQALLAMLRADIAGNRKRRTDLWSGNPARPGPLGLEQGVDERTQGRPLGKDNQQAQQEQTEDDGGQPELLADLEKGPELAHQGPFVSTSHG